MKKVTELYKNFLSAGPENGMKAAVNERSGICPPKPDKSRRKSVKTMKMRDFRRLKHLRCEIGLNSFNTYELRRCK